MLIPPRLLKVSLLAVVLCFPAALGQQSGPVNIRQRVVVPAAGLPTVNVTVDRNRIPVNDEVTFTLSPAGVIANRDYKIILQFGDGAQTQTHATQVIHRYRAPGNYKYSISIAADQSRVKPPQIPKVTLSAAPAAVSIDQPVVFNAQLSEKYPNIEYRFAFADGSQTSWQKDPQTKHQYASPRTYLAYVDIGEAVGQSVRRIGGSERTAIKVSQSGSSQMPTVRLAAKPVKIKTRQFVSFTAKVVSNDTDVKYRFIFGDQTPATNWQVKSATRHRYLAPGNYSARVDVRVVNKQAGVQKVSSSPLSIEVKTAAEQPIVRLTATPASIGEHVPVFFRANLDSRNEDIRYRFNFGDGSEATAWTDKAFETHAYARAGRYSPYVEIGRFTTGPIDAIASSARSVTVTAFLRPDDATPTPTPAATPTPNLSSPLTVTTTPASNTPSPSRGTVNSNTGSPETLRTETTPDQKNDPPPSPWWPYFLIPLALYAAYRILKALAAPRPTFHPRLDKGVSEVGVEKPLTIDFQVQLNPDISAGEYGIKSNEASFIRSERKSND